MEKDRQAECDCGRRSIAPVVRFPRQPCQCQAEREEQQTTAQDRLIRKRGSPLKDEIDSVLIRGKIHAA